MICNHRAALFQEPSDRTGQISRYTNPTRNVPDLPLDRSGQGQPPGGVQPT